MRIVKQSESGRKQPSDVQFGLAFVGTAWCIQSDRYLVTAHHVLNNGKARDVNDRFYVVTAPQNGPAAYHFPVVGFPLEDSANDFAVLEIGPPTNGQHIPAVPITFAQPGDGGHVVTYGFPAPAIKGGKVARDGTFLGGGQFFLKGHANEGIVSAQYDVNGARNFEFNVGWHHGESGGPVFRREPVAAFAIMQRYRNISGPHGVVAGPHMGRALEVVRQQLTPLAATIV